MRSRLHERGLLLGRQGIISACAEQTGLTPQGLRINGDHLRVCGADQGVWECVRIMMGSSPRVRSRRTGKSRRTGAGGIISACAEQTSRARTGPDEGRDHLRVCGADRYWSARCSRRTGSSPRVRSRQRAPGGDCYRVGIISACAEQTDRTSSKCSEYRDHLRVCGADSGFPR